MILGSETSDNSDEVYLPAAQKNRDILEEYFVLEKMHAPSITSSETFYSSEEDDLFYASKYLAYELEDVSRDFDEERSVSPLASFTYTSCSSDTSGLPLTHLDAGAVRDLRCLHVLSVYDDLILSSVEEDSDELTQEEILQLIQCSTEPPKHQQENDYDGQKQIFNVKYMGFPNIENTCYMNSTLQCLLSIPPIIKDIVLQENTWKNEPGSEMLRAFYDLDFARLNKTQNMPRKHLLAAVKDCIAIRNPGFVGNEQQDAHEFLITLLAQLKDEAVMCQQAEMTFRSPVANLEFRVNRLRTCETCGNQSCSTEEVNCLSLVTGPQKSLIESLQQYFATSQLECRCDKCSGTQASESVEIQTLPRVLVLLVMRFDMFTARKIKGRLAVPEELSLASFTGSDSCEQAADLYSKEATQQAHIKTNAKQQQADASYKLSGVVSHYGSSLHSGHFVSNILDPCGAEWLSCDDNTVKSVTWSKASNTIENHGYMFFYLKS
ncbi:ubiquitin carboxyl-terminal hydrolase 37-like isoform X1 [Triplophysa rosa]|uniref:ubiquitin carboxyl-terminal hydrolase 37-like isoform X1 n=1 Tax=Triplophysa rosa TaxID=992332 RepID=UPI002545E28A|nr:ubiquitin carboxyl-terminal hydrolase 37-like isoform X1 [Triplophysa rosa]